MSPAFEKTQEARQKENAMLYWDFGLERWKTNGDPKKDTVYVGELRNGVPHGEGTLTFPDGGKYVGEFKEGKIHGQGTATYPDGSKYVGEWQDGNWHGQGTFTYPDGTKYVGEFKDGKPWSGKFYDKYGNVVGTSSNGVEK